MSTSYELDGPDHFTAGAVGAPGERAFYLQAREAGRVVTLKAEKEQVRALGEYLAGVLVRLGAAGVTAGAGEAKLLEPFAEAWAIGAIAVGYDGNRDRILIEARELQEEETEGTAAREPATARFAISRDQAAAFVERARALMKTGRPTCPMCDQTLTPGHVCPRANGHAVRQ